MADLNLLHKNKGIAHLIAFLKENGERRIIRRKEYFIREGGYHDEIAYILRGSFKLYTYDYRQKEQILSFSFDHELVACFLPPRNGTTALLNVQAMEDSVVLALPLEKLLPLIQIETHTGIYVHNFVESLAFDFLKKNLSFRCDPPELRYQQLIERVPDVLNRVSVKDIALYIGVTPETLSRIRSRMLWEKE